MSPAQSTEAYRGDKSSSEEIDREKSSLKFWVGQTLVRNVSYRPRMSQKHGKVTS